MSIELLNILSKDIEEFTMNDDGSKFKDKLSKFDISRDKKFGDKWDFKVNKDSLEIIKEVINYYFNKEWVIGNGI